MGVDISKPEKFITRTELLAIVYALYKFRVYVFGHDFYNPETINKYCCIPSHKATVTNGFAWFWDRLLLPFNMGKALIMRIHVYLYSHVYISRVQ
jgi:hypothetical protein